MQRGSQSLLLSPYNRNHPPAPYPRPLDQDEKDSTLDLICSSKRLIKEMQEKKRNLNVSGGRMEDEISSKGPLSLWGNKKLSTKQKIEGTLKSIKNISIAEQLLPNTASDTSQKAQYLRVVENMFSSNSTKKKRRKSKTNSPSSELQGRTQARQTKLSYQTLSTQLQKQLARKVRMSQKSISEGEEQNLSENHSKKVQSAYIEQEMDELEEELKSVKNMYKQKGNATKPHPSRVSIKLGSRNQINHHQHSQQSSLISLSSDSQSDQGQGGTANPIFGMQNFMASMSSKIDEDIRKFRSSQKQLPETDYIGENKARPTEAENARREDQYSFRQHNSNELNESDEFSVPRQQPNKTYPIRQQQEGVDNVSQLPYYTDYGSGLSQHRISRVLHLISNRVKYSRAVIEPVMYEHWREDNNQLQIETRYKKQSSQRSEVALKILAITGGREVRFDHIKSKANTYPLGWKSPGIPKRREKFVSLGSPILNQLCCNAKKKVTFDPTNHRKLLECRSAETLATISPSFLEKKGRLGRTTGKEENRSDSSSSYEFQIEQELDARKKQCIIEEKWDSVKRQRRRVEIY